MYWEWYNYIMANGIIHQKQCLKEFRHPASTNFDEIWKFKPQYEVKKIQIGIARRKKKFFFLNISLKIQENEKIRNGEGEKEVGNMKEETERVKTVYLIFH